MARHSGGILTGFALLVAAIGCAFVLGIKGQTAHAAINTQINFQGKLTNPDGTNVTNGTYSILYSIYTVSSGGVAVWSETQPSVSVTDGIFNVALGSVSALPGSVDFNSSSLYLGVTVGVDPEMTPRILFTAAPYAHNSDSLDGLDSTAFARLSQNQTFTGTNTFQPTTNIPSVVVRQSSFGSPTADIFNVQTANSTTVMQVTGPAANEAAVTLQSVGATRALTLTSQASATWSSAAGTLTMQGGTGITMASAAQTTIGSGVVTIQSGATSVTASTNSGDINLTTGNAAGVTSNSGSIALNVGSATGTRGSINIGTGANAPASISIGQATVTTTGILGATINIGTVGAGTAASTIRISDTSNATGVQAVTIGSAAANVSNSVTLNSGAVTQTNTNSGVTIQTDTNTSTALQVQNSSNIAVLAVDTNATVANNLITTLTASGTPSFEAASTTGWTGVNGCTLTSVTSAGSNPVGSIPYSGTYSGQCVNTASANAQFRYVTGALSTNTVYTLSFYAKVSATQGGVLNFGHRENGGAEDVANLSLTGQQVTSTGWTRYSLTFRTGGTLAAGDYLYIKQSDATARTLWIDGVTFQLDANNNGNYSEGSISAGGVINSSLILQNAVNTNTAFQVANTTGAAVFTVDTTDYNLVSNPGAEINATGWSTKGSAAAPIRDTSQVKYGFASFKTVTTAAANDGAQFALSPSLPVGTYSIGFSAKISGTAFGSGALVAGLTNGAGDNNCTLSPATGATLPTTTGWTRFTCSVTIATTAATAFYIKQTEAVIHTIWFDGVEIDSGNTSLPYGLGSMSLNGVITSPTLFKNQSDSNQAFMVMNAASSAIFSVNTVDSEVQIGSNVTDTTQVNLQLDSFSTFTETATCTTTTNQGSMYYNTASHVMRGCIDGAWEDLPSTKSIGLLLFGVVPDSANATSPGDIGGVSGLVNSPCMVTWSATQQVTVNPCVAFSGGRKVVIPSTTISTAALAANAYANVCLTGANNQPALGAGNATETSAAVPTFSANNPILCLATVRASAVAGNVGFIWDVRTFTNTSKTFATVDSVASPGYLVIQTTTNNVLRTTATGSFGPSAGVIVATTGTTSTTAINAIIANDGSQYVKVLSGGTATAGAVVQTTTTAGYARTSATYTTSYSSFGLVQRGQAITGGCTAATNCQYSALAHIKFAR